MDDTKTQIRNCVEELELCTKEIAAFLAEQAKRGIQYVGGKEEELIPAARTVLARSLYDNTSKELRLAALEQIVKGCKSCQLHKTRHNVVFGQGNANAALMLIGEGPGESEDLQGVPFVGKAGKLLTLMLAAIGIDRKDVYITNVVKCRPPGNRDPRPEEIAACIGYLKEQIRIIEPKVILCLGRPSAHTVLKTSQPLTALRSKIHKYDGIDVVVTYHPAYLLRNPSRKREAWRDLKRLAQLLAHHNLITLPYKWWEVQNEK